MVPPKAGAGRRGQGQGYPVSCPIHGAVRSVRAPGSREASWAGRVGPCAALAPQEEAAAADGGPLPVLLPQDLNGPGRPLPHPRWHLQPSRCKPEGMGGKGQDCWVPLGSRRDSGYQQPWSPGTRRLWKSRGPGTPRKRQGWNPASALWPSGHFPQDRREV